MRTEHGATLGPFVVAVDGDLNDSYNCAEATIDLALAEAVRLVQVEGADADSVEIWAKVPIDLVVDVTAKVAGERK